MAEEIQFPEGMMRARHTLGRISHDSGNVVEAETYFQSALATVRENWPSLQAQVYLDLAILARAPARPNTAAIYLCKAYTVFQQLQMPKWAERTEQLAQEYGVTLTEVELDELTEGTS